MHGQPGDVILDAGPHFDLTGVNAFTHDKIASAVLAEHAPWSRAIAEALGGQVWRPETLAAARDAHRHPPELRTHDRLGRRIDTVDFHPAYHELMSSAFGHGVHALAWTADQPGAQLARRLFPTYPEPFPSAFPEDWLPPQR